MAPPNQMNKDPRYAGYKIGRFTSGDPRIEASWCNSSTLEIGSFCSIARNCTIFLGGNHHYEWLSTASLNYFLGYDCTRAGRSRFLCPKPSKGPVIIGSDVWIATGVTIMENVKIGHGAIIAANSHVVKDIPDYGIVGGNPARLIKLRFPQEQIDALVKIAWWNWPDEKIKENIPLIMSPDVQPFIDKHKVL
jgi:acetyltransferase-like isoleucine patch superfamily enzyme